MYKLFSSRYKRQVIVIGAGEYYTSNKGDIISTVVGSCICTCLYDPVHLIGGVNHFMLPAAIKPSEILTTEPGRYGIYAMELLIGEIIKLGGERQYLKAKVFGGGELLHYRFSHNNNIPKFNIEFINNFLKMEQIPIVNQDVGGNFGRKLYFFSDTGKVYVKKLVPQQYKGLKDIEERYTARLFRIKEKCKGLLS